MAEYATGGYIEVDNYDVPPVPLTRGCAYAIPSEFAKEWAKSVLDRINEGLDKPDEDGVE